MGHSRRHVRDRLHHRIPDTAIVQRVSGAFDETNLRVGPHCMERSRGGGIPLAIGDHAEERETACDALAVATSLAQLEPLA